MKKIFILFILSTILLFPFCKKSFNSLEIDNTLETDNKCKSELNKINLIFKYGVNEKNILNTFGCTYTKDMVLDPSITTSLHLESEELDSIYQKIQQIDFFNYPDTFYVKITGDVVGEITPFPTFDFYVEVDTIEKRLYWENKITNPNQKADELREVIRLIIKIIESKKEYQQLPEPKGGYL